MVMKNMVKNVVVVCCWIVIMNYENCCVSSSFINIEIFNLYMVSEKWKLSFVICC